MLCMTKGETERSGIRRCSRVTLLIVADAAGGHLATCKRLAVRRMTTVTVVVRVETGRNRERRATPQPSTVTSSTALARSHTWRQMLRVIELYIEAFIESRRKTFEGRGGRFYIGVTNLAHRNGRSKKLAQVTVSARLVPGKARRDRVVGRPLMTRVTRERRMPLAGVKKPGVIETGILEKSLRGFCASG